MKALYHILQEWVCYEYDSAQ